MVDATLSILHVDMDAFYASIEQRDRPELAGKPVIVGGIGGRGVVCAASYEARPFGVHSAMPTSIALRLCPNAIFLPLRMGHYATISRQIQEIFSRYTPLVEPLSLDEAFLDVRGCQLLFGPAPKIASDVKAHIRRETGLTASVGVAPNKFLAKLASDHGKPDGLVIVEAQRVTEFLRPLPVSRLWGVGAKGEKRLHALGLRTIGQLADLPEHILGDHFGGPGRHLWRLAHGQDDRVVVADRDAKSISTETTFGRDIEDRDCLRAWLLELTDQLASRLRRHGILARSVDLKLRSSDFRTRHRTQTLAEPTNSTDLLWQAARGILEKALIGDLLPLRLLGIAAGRLTRDQAAQLDLFDAGQRQRRQCLDQAIDAIRGQFGADSLRRGSVIDRRDQ